MARARRMDKSNSDGWTPLSRAYGEGHLIVTRLVVDAGSSPVVGHHPLVQVRAGPPSVMGPLYGQRPPTPPSPPFYRSKTYRSRALIISVHLHHVIVVICSWRRTICEA